MANSHLFCFNTAASSIALNYLVINSTQPVNTHITVIATNAKLAILSLKKKADGHCTSVGKVTNVKSGRQLPSSRSTYSVQLGKKYAIVSMYDAIPKFSPLAQLIRITKH